MNLLLQAFYDILIIQIQYNLRQFYAAPAPGKNFDAAPAPALAPALLYSKARCNFSIPNHL
jgi:hypothetical protein